MKTKMNLGVMLRSTLKELYLEEDYDGDYDQFSFMQTRGHQIKEIPSPKELENIVGLDAVFLFRFPFNESLNSKLVNYEEKFCFINRPSGILKTSKKTYELENWQKYLPESILINHSQPDEWTDFIKKNKGAIIKPVDGTGGRGVQKINYPLNDRNEIVKKIEELNKTEESGYLMQRFVENQGDERILCYNGRVMGHFGRHNPNSITNNISGGGFLTNPGPLSKDKKDMAEEISGELIKQGVYFIGLDFIDNCLLEINTACPGGIGLVKPAKGYSAHDNYRLFEEETRKIIKDYV